MAPESDLEALRQQLLRLGYLAWHSLLSAMDFGMPHHRVRYYIGGYLVSPDDLVGEAPAWLAVAARIVQDANGAASNWAVPCA